MSSGVKSHPRKSGEAVYGNKGGSRGGREEKGSGVRKACCSARTWPCPAPASCPEASLAVLPGEGLCVPAGPQTPVQAAAGGAERLLEPPWAPRVLRETRVHLPLLETRLRARRPRRINPPQHSRKGASPGCKASPGSCLPFPRGSGVHRVPQKAKLNF